MLQRIISGTLCLILLFTIGTGAALAGTNPAQGGAKADQAGAKAAYAEPKASQTVDLAPNAMSAVLMDADTGTIIVGKNMDAKLPPASITKIMTMLLIMESVESGKIKMSDKVATSEHAASMGGSQIFLEPGEQMTVQEMLKGIAMASGNDASVAMAEKIAGSEENFVEMMNERAEQLGMKNTHFVNCNGLPAANHYTSARDIAIMSRELLKHPEITKYTGAYQDYLRKDSEKPFWLVNTNKLVRFYSGADGLKTGFTSEAKFCLSATALRDNFRIIAVVMGEPNTKTRNSEVTKLFDFAFAQYTNFPIFKKGDNIGSFDIVKGEVRTMELVADRPYSILLKKGDTKDGIRHELEIAPGLEAPVAAGQPIGKLVVYKGDTQLAEFQIKSPVAIGKAGWWTLFKRSISSMF